MNEPKRNIPASIKSRLLVLAKERREELEYTLVRYACERFLYRLGESPHRDRFILKGASLFLAWTTLRYRPTRDLDLLGHGPDDADAVRRAFQDVCAVDCPEDGLRFDPGSFALSDIRTATEYEGKRVKLAAFLGKAVIALQIDVGFGDAVTPRALATDYPVALSLPAPRIRMYPRETVVAEKFEAMVRLGARTSRLKDFFDLAAMATIFDFDGAGLREAIWNTFERRKTAWTPDQPETMRPDFYLNPVRIGQWETFLRGSPPLAGMPSGFEAFGDQIRTFLEPVRQSMLSNSPFNARWPAGGPWTTAKEPSR